MKKRYNYEVFGHNYYAIVSANMQSRAHLGFTYMYMDVLGKLFALKSDLATSLAFPEQPTFHSQ
jgi:hypothetical protein